MEELIAETGELSAAQTVAMSEAARHQRESQEKDQRIASLQAELARLQGVLSSERSAQGAVEESKGDREAELEQALLRLRSEAETAATRARDAEAAYASSQAKIEDITGQLELLRNALDDKDEEFQVIADALVEAESAKADAERDLRAAEARLAERPSGDATANAALRDENDRLQSELAQLRAQLAQAQDRDGSRELVEQAVHSKDKRITQLEEELSKALARLQSGPAGEGGDEGRLAELSAELANSQKKVKRLEDTIIRLRANKG
jgi:DNA repair exonuclease SbcCD ATPase subunit